MSYRFLRRFDIPRVATLLGFAALAVAVPFAAAKPRPALVVAAETKDATGKTVRTDKASESKFKIGDVLRRFALPPLTEGVAKGPKFLATTKYLGRGAEDPAKVLVLSFWASWCESCKKEMPMIEKFAKQNAAAGLRVLAIAIDQDEPGIAAARKFVADKGFTFDVVLDKYNIVVKRFFTGDQITLPAMLIIDAEGRIQSIHAGMNEGEFKAITTKIQEMLAAG